MVDDSKPLIVETVIINGHCSGEQWTLLDYDQLAYLIAIIALGQAQHVAVVLEQLPRSATRRGFPVRTNNDS